MRADGTAANLAAAVGPTTDATKCMSVATYNAASPVGDDIIYLSDKGGAYGELIPHTGGTSGHQIKIMAAPGEYPIITGTGHAGIHTNSKSYLTFQGLTIDGQNTVGDYALLYISGSTGVVVNYCQIKNSTGDGISAINSPSAVINNCTVVGNAGAGIRASGTGDVTVKNCLISGNGYSGGSYGLRATAPATLTYSYSLITGNSYSPSNNIQSSAQITDAGNNIKESVSQLNKYKNNTAYFVISFDDSDYGYWTDVAAAIAPYGAKITAYAIGSSFSGNSTAEAALVALKNAGHEIGNHSWSHSDLTATTAFTVTTTNTGTNTYTVNRTAKTLTLTSSGNPENNVTVDWSSVVRRIDYLKNAVIGKGWTITNTTNVGDLVNLDSLADTGGAIAITIPAALDVTSGHGYPYWANEIGVTQTYLTGVLGSAPTSMGNMFDNTNAGLQSYQQAVTGLVGAKVASGKSIGYFKFHQRL